MTSAARANLHAIANSYSEVFFLRGWRLGALVLAVTLLNPHVAGAGLAAVLAAYLFARFIDMDPAFLDSGFYTYNPLLVGLSVGYLFQLTPLTLFFAVVAGVSAFVLTHMLHSIFWHYLKLPILSLPFVLVSSTAYLAASRYSNLHVTGLYPNTLAGWETSLPAWMAGFFQSLGAIFFMPYVATGAIFALGLLMASRILLLLAVGGYYAGTLAMAWLGGSYPQALGDLNAFNFILIAMAMGGVFLVPSMKSYLMAILAVGASTLLMTSTEVFWSTYGVPVFALPFNVVTLTLVYVLGLEQFPLVAKGVATTPEQRLDEHVCNHRRYPGSPRTLALPFSGRWTVWQGFDGEWTHQGPWRHAYDFVITGEDGRTHAGDGTRLDQYHAFRKPVLSPVRGRIVRVVQDQPDNPIGVTDRARNWGNLVVIADERDFFVEISHLAEGSIRVEEGAWVERGSLLGLCGNSGYSPQPHIHIQVQPTDEIGSATLPFSFVTYVAEGRFHANELPAVDRIVEPVFPDKGLDVRMGFVLDETFTFEGRENGVVRGRTTLTVRMAADGTFYLDSGSGRLYFGKHEDTFYFYRLEGDEPELRALFLALPRLPLAFRQGMSWIDHVPLSLVTRGLRRAGAHLLRSVDHRFGQVRTTLRFVDEGSVRGTVTSRLLGTSLETEAELDPFRGVRRVKIGDYELQRVDEEESP